MNFAPKAESELKSFPILKSGEYDFEVLAARDTKSKSSGSDMIEVNLGIYEGDAVRARVFDYLLPAMEAKLRHFCDCTGLLAKYEAGTLCADDCKGRTGRCKLIVDVDKTGQYDDKNAVKDYVCRAAKPLTPRVPESPNRAPISADDEVPF